MSYRAKHGPLCMQVRMEQLIAAQMHHLNTINGGKAEFSKFLLFSNPSPVEDEKEATIDDFMMILSTSAATNKAQSKNR